MSSSAPLLEKSFTRRSVLGGLSAAPFIAGCAPKNTWSATETDVLIIGAGMSGLAAALTLESEGVDVVLVEADDRLGGRCHTLRVDGEHYDCGATTIGPLYGRVRNFATLAGVELTSPPSRHGFCYHINGTFLTADEWESSAANKLSSAERSIRPEALEFTLLQKHNKITALGSWNSQDMLQHDIAYDQYLLANGVSAEAVRLISCTTNSANMSETSALFQMREFARLALPNNTKTQGEVYAPAGRKNYHYVKGGTSRLIDGMANLLKVETRLNSPVTAIDVKNDGVDVTLKSGDRIKSKSVICTIPYGALENIKITPEISGPKKEAINQSKYTTTTHIFCRPKRPYWEQDGGLGGLVSDSTIDRMFATNDENGQVAWLDIWLNGENAAQLDSMSEAERNRHVLAELARLRPSTEGNLEILGTYSWGNNSYIRGNKQVLAPGQVSSIYPEIATPWLKRLRFAGEHTREIEAGLEAAAASGIREAFTLLEELI